MAFIKKDWKCGDTITADDLNRLENGVEEALEGGEVDCGYSCSEEYVTLTEESVTTEDGDFSVYGSFAYSELITADTIKVTFNGTEYTCSKQVVSSTDVEYGAPFDEATGQNDWSDYPFAIASGSTGNLFVTETAGTYQVKIEAFEEIVQTSGCFDKAVRLVSSPLRIKYLLPPQPIPSAPALGWSFDASTINVSVTKSYDEIKNAYDAGRLCIVTMDGQDVLVTENNNIFIASHTQSGKTVASGADGSLDIWSVVTSKLQITNAANPTLVRTIATYAQTRS